VQERVSEREGFVQVNCNRSTARTASASLNPTADTGFYENVHTCLCLLVFVNTGVSIVRSSFQRSPTKCLNDSLFLKHF
jgi:hypothetical protein